MPVYWVYITGWATPEGIVQFRDDIYQRDGLGAIAAYQAAPAGAGDGHGGSAPQPQVQPVRATNNGGGERLQPMNDDEE